MRRRKRTDSTVARRLTFNPEIYGEKGKECIACCFSVYSFASEVMLKNRFMTRIFKEISIYFFDD